MTRALVWTVLGAVAVLATRTIVYALTPWQAVLAAELEHKAGGPRLAVVTAVALAVAAVAAAGVLWVAAVAVRERLLLERRAVVAPPRLAPVRLVARAAAFFVATSFAFAMLESYIHWRAGLGWHGLHCLLGPVHRDALPVLGGLALLAVALHGAVEHLLAWTRRLVAQLAARLPLVRPAPPGFFFDAVPRAVPSAALAAPRGPPAWAVA